MNLKETKIALNKFGKYVIQQSKSNLSKLNKRGKLYNSLKFKPTYKKDSIILSFLGEDYANFVDQGVKGANPSNVSPNAKIRGQQAPNSKFRFGSGSARGTFDKFAKSMSLFAKNRNIRFRDKKGKFVKGGYDAMGYVIAKNIYARGIKPSLFFTKPFEKAFKELNPELIQAYKIDVVKEIKKITK